MWDNTGFLIIYHSWKLEDDPRNFLYGIGFLILDNARLTSCQFLSLIQRPCRESRSINWSKCWDFHPVQTRRQLSLGWTTLLYKISGENGTSWIVMWRPEYTTTSRIATCCTLYYLGMGACDRLCSGYPSQRSASVGQSSSYWAYREGSDKRAKRSPLPEKISRECFKLPIYGNVERKSMTGNELALTVKWGYTSGLGLHCARRIVTQRPWVLC